MTKITRYQQLHNAALESENANHKMIVVQPLTDLGETVTREQYEQAKDDARNLRISPVRAVQIIARYWAQQGR